MSKIGRTSDFYKQSFQLVLLCFSMIWLLGGVWGISIHRLVADGEDSLPLSLIYLVFSLLLALLPIGIIRNWLLGLPMNMTSNKSNDTIEASASANSAVAEVKRPEVSNNQPGANSEGIY